VFEETQVFDLNKKNRLIHRKWSCLLLLLFKYIEYKEEVRNIPWARPGGLGAGFRIRGHAVPLAEKTISACGRAEIAAIVLIARIARITRLDRPG
jgi:hypothetical protein